MNWSWHYLILIRVILILVWRHLWIEMQCTWKTFMIHQTFVRWALYILLIFVKSLTRHLDLAIGNVRCVQWFSWTLEMAPWIFWTMWLTSIRHWHNTIMSHWHLNDINPKVFASWVHVIQTGAIIKCFMNLMTLYTALQWLRQNINQSINSQKMTPYFTLKGELLGVFCHKIDPSYDGEYNTWSINQSVIFTMLLPNSTEQWRDGCWHFINIAPTQFTILASTTSH